jgi:hypothetical protein
VLAPLEGGFWQLTYVNTVGGSETLMVVPIPNKHGLTEEDFVLSAVFEPDASRMRFMEKRCFRPYAPPPVENQSRAASGFGSASFAAAAGGPPPLAVQRVGSYQISVAPTLNDLETRAPWTRYPSAMSRVGVILDDMRRTYPDGYAFVIAQSTAEVKETGFAVVYKDASPFIPTAHEVTAAAGSGSGMAEMDATILAFNTVLLPHTIGTSAQVAPPTEATIDEYPTYRCDDSGSHTLSPRWEGAVSLLRALPVRGAGELHRDKLLRHARPTMLCRWKLKGTYRNENVLGREATVTDVEAMRETFDQLDAFLTHRTTLGESSLVPGAQPVPEPTLESTRASRPAAGFSFGGPSSGWSPPPRAAYESEVLARHGKAIDFSIVLEGRQLAYPGIADRVSDVPPPPGAPPGLPQSEMFLNLDVAAVRGLDRCVDLDSAAFARKDEAQLCTLADGSSLSGSVYLRISATPAPSLVPQSVRTVKGGPLGAPTSAPAAAAPAAAASPFAAAASPPPVVGVPVMAAPPPASAFGTNSWALPPPPSPAFGNVPAAASPPQLFTRIS